ncbi:MAG: hypothetical protein KatS3mg093_126 [Candidatus Parcubacteria bacterium]|nr:MAG: hypothetical protein KatS3mg093_126 [Candidatus Parcubacteria bacterium]
MLNFTNLEKENFEPRQVVVRKVIPKGGKNHLIEITYKEIRPNLWQEITDSEKDLGVVQTEFYSSSQEEHDSIMGPNLPAEQRSLIKIVETREINNETHLVEITYEKIRENCLQKLYGSEKDLGKILDESKKSN